MAYSFKTIFNPTMRRLFETIFNVTSGHDHDGTNSKAVTVGTVADDAITTAKILNGALSADATGRAKMANNFVNAAKIEADAVTTAKILDANVTLAKMSTAAKTRTFNYRIEDLAAGADITARAIFFTPAGVDITLTDVSIIPEGASAGIDDSNTCVIAATDGTNTIVTQTYDTDPTFPAANAVTSLGALDATYKVLSAGEKLYIAITNGATANPPAMTLQVTYTVAVAA